MHFYVHIVAQDAPSSIGLVRDKYVADSNIANVSLQPASFDFAHCDPRLATAFEATTFALETNSALNERSSLCHCLRSSGKM